MTLPSEHDGFVAFGPCWLCGASFPFHPDKVPAVPIDPETRRPLDVDAEGRPMEIDPAARERAVKMPICEQCYDLVNERRIVLGQPLWVVPPGAYP